ncbi:hypothetical protein FRX31_015632 [Thalictrum thalictroides]|uniref:DUF4283 domain-containing protein n=1 Tax=Thalictrum thalictroides TaxID=46969 RepID=A0A7J6WD05_THATH|nr:hypothetical protein FRX31_015632 [Thalictrum thalictroides]
MWWGFFIERRISFPVVREALKRQWKLKADYEMVADKDYFFFKFNLKEDKTTVLDAGPVFIAGRIFILQPWSDMTEKEMSQINTIPIWAHLYDVPKKLWSGPGLSCLSSMIGKPLRCDEATAKKTRLNYARICVEVKVGVSLLDVLKTRFEGEEYTVHVDYPWKPLSCSDCNIFGHSTGSCKVEKQWKPAPRRQNFVKKVYKQVSSKDKGQTSGTKENEMIPNAKSDMVPTTTVVAEGA